MKHLVNKSITEKVPFMGDEVEVRKLTVGQIMDMQKIIQKAEKSKADDAQLKLLCDIIKIAVVGAEDLSEEDFSSFPLGELSELSTHVMRVSGLGGVEGN
jgi:hypothetical protein